MRKLFALLLLLTLGSAYSQYRGTRQYVPFVRTEDYVTNSPGNSHSNSVLIAYYKDSTAMGFKYPSIEFWSFKSDRNDGTPTSIAWFDEDGYLQRSDFPTVVSVEEDPVWEADKTNYYTKTTSDGRYLQSYTEEDPTVSAAAKTITSGDVTSWNGKQAALVSGTNIKTLESLSLLGSGNIDLAKSDVGLSNVDNTSDLNKPISTATQTALDGKVPIIRTVNGYALSSNIMLAKGDVGLGNVDNTSDLNKPISTATQTALNGKADVTTDNDVTRTINSSTYTVSSTKKATVRYVIKISCTATIGSASTGRVLFQYSTNGGSSWIDGGEVENSNTVSLAVVLNSVTTQTGCIVWNIPANALCRLVPTTSGTTTITWVKGQETY